MSRHKQRLNEIVPKLRHIYAYFWPQIRQYRRTIATSLLALLASVALRLLEPWPLKVLLDDVLSARDMTRGEGMFDRVAPQTLLLGVAVAVVLIAVSRSLADYVSRVGFFIVGNNVVIKVRDQVYRHLQRLSLNFHSRARSGDLIIRVTRDVSLIRDVTGTAMLPLIASTAVLLGMVIVMFVLSWQLTLLALLTFPLFWLTTLRLGKKIRETARRQREREGAMASTAAEALGAIRIIKAMRLEERFATAFGRRNANSQKEDLKASRLSVRLGRIIDVLLAFSSALVIWFGGKLALQGLMTPGDIIVFLTYLKRSFKPAQDLAKYVARLSKAAAAGERVIEILETEKEITDTNGAVPAPSLEGRIRLSHVSFAYGDGRPVLTDLDLEIEPRELVCLVGPSGGGKSTILGLLLRFFDPQVGHVEMDGQDIRHFTIDSLRDQTSTVMQDPLLLADTVYENIACAAHCEVTETAVIAAARLANAFEFVEQLPAAFDANIGERGATLSRGQQQRIAVARAAIRKAPILLLDEPTTGLDEESEQVVLEALLRLARGRTTLLVTHNLALAAQADRIVFLDAGRIREQGTHEELIAIHGRYANWYAKQQSRHRRMNTNLSVVSW